MYRDMLIVHCACNRLYCADNRMHSACNRTAVGPFKGQGCERSELPYLASDREI